MLMPGLTRVRLTFAGLTHVRWAVMMTHREDDAERYALQPCGRVGRGHWKYGHAVVYFRRKKDAVPASRHLNLMGPWPNTVAVERRLTPKEAKKLAADAMASLRTVGLHELARRAA